MPLVITPEIRVPVSELEMTYVRSSGPGGQNVNKVNSKAVLRWNIHSSPSLSGDTRAWILARLGARITSAGDIVVSSDRFRDQGRNREDCIDKFVQMIAAAAFRPKKRKKTKPSFSSRRKVKEMKGRLSQKKTLRKSPRDYD